jgi:hypothetical protein
MAQTTDLVDGATPVDHMSLTWTDWYDWAEETHSSSYYVSDGQLQRDYDGTVTTLARFISGVEFSLSGRLLTVKITSSPQGDYGPSEERVYQVYLRPG